MSLFRSNEDTGFENNSMFISRKEIQTLNDSYYTNPVMKVYNDVKNINNNPIMTPSNPSILNETIRSNGDFVFDK